MRLRRKANIALLVAGLCAGVFGVAAPAQAYTGGGCSGYGEVSIGTATAFADSCASGGARNATSTYFFEADSPSSWQSCTITINLRDDTAGTTVVSNAYNCLGTARAGNDYYGSNGYLYTYLSGHHYHTYVLISVEYAGTWFDNVCSANLCAFNSPELYY